MSNKAFHKLEKRQKKKLKKFRKHQRLMELGKTNV